MKQRFLRTALMLVLIFCSTVVWADDGDEFEITSGNVTLTYHVISEANKTCMLGKRLDAGNFQCAFTATDGWDGSVTVPGKITNPGNGTEYTVIEIGCFAFWSWDYKLKSITLPNTIIKIEQGAFEGTEITSIDLPASLQDIRVFAFQNSKLTSISIPKSVSEIGDYYNKSIDGNPFIRCPFLTNITIEAGNPRYEAADGGKIIYDKKYKGIVTAIGNAVIPDGTRIIGGDAFGGNSDIKSIIVPESVTTVGNGAFAYCNNLESVTLPESLERLDGGVFKGCSKLTNIVLPTGIKCLYNDLFYGSGLTEITIPKNVTEINDQAFGNCENLATVTSMIKEPFDVNKNVFSKEEWDNTAGEYKYTIIPTTLKVPYGTKALYEAREGWKEFPNIVEMEQQPDEPAVGDEITDGDLKFIITSIKNQTCRLGESKEYYIDGRWIMTYPFNKDIESLTIPSTVQGFTVTAIPAATVRNLDNLKSVSLPSTISSIGEENFQSCWSLESITIDDANPTYRSSDCNVIIESATNTIIASCKTSTIPDGVERIGEGVFQNSEITSLTLPSTLKVIERNAFSNCYRLTSVELPASITSIGDYAFAFMSNLGSVTVNTTTPIDISEYAFIKSQNWDDNTYTYTNREYYDNLFVPAGAKEAYKNHAVWGKFKNFFSGNEGKSFTANTTEGVEMVFTILEDNSDSKTCQVGYFDGDYEKNAVEPNAVNGTVTIPGVVNGYKVVKIGRYAFCSTMYMTSVVIPESVTAIDDNAFQGCSGMNSFMLPKNVQSLGEQVLRYCRNLQTLTVEDGNTVYSSPSGSNCIIETATYKLIAVGINADIPEGVTAIPGYLIDWGYGINITIPSTVTSIGSRAFEGIQGSTITVKWSNPLQIAEDVFSQVNIYGDKSYLRVPAGLKAAYKVATGWSMFGDEYILAGNEGTTFTANTTEGVEVLYTILDDEEKTCQVGYMDGSWDKSAVVNQSNNGAITISDEVNGYKVVKVGRYAFYNAYSMTSVVLPQTITEIEDYAFFRCSQLGSFMLPKGVTSLGNFVFLSCGNLTSLSVEDGNPIYSSSEGSNVIIETAANKVVIGSTHATIPSGVTSIGDNVFNNVNGGEISIPSTVTTIGNQAFANMYNSTVTVEWDAPIAIDESVFQWSNNNYLRVPEGTKTAYQAATGWSTFGEDHILEGRIGETFTVATTEGVEVLYTILSDNTNSKTCQVGYMEGEWNKTAIDGNSAEGIVTIPDEVNGYKVVKVGKYAFYNAYRMTSVVLPQTVTEIENYAFANCGLTKFVLPKSVTRIGQSIFQFCSGLTSLTVEGGNPVFSSPEGSNVIIETAANKVVTGLTHATIPTGVTSIGESAFYNVYGAEITIPSTVTTIEDEAFASMYYSTIIVKSESPIAINERVFLWGSNNYLRVPEGSKAAYLAATGWSTFGEDHILEGRVGETFTAATVEGIDVVYTIIDDHAKTCQVGYLGGYKKAVEPGVGADVITIPEEVNGYHVVKVGETAFYMTDLKSVILPQTVTEIEAGAFGYSGLQSFVLPKSVTKLGVCVFQSCDVNPLTVEEGNPVFSSPEGSNVIIETASKKVVTGARKATIPAGVTSIGERAFFGMNYGEFSIPSTVTTIEDEAFTANYNSSVTVEWQSPIAVGENVIDGRDGSNLFVPVGTKAAYLAAAGWSTFGDDHIIECTAGQTFTAKTLEAVDVAYTILDTDAKECQVGYIDGNEDNVAVNRETQTFRITIPESIGGYTVAEIGQYAFQGVMAESVVIPQTVTAIGEYAFAGCTALTAIYSHSVEPIPLGNAEAKVRTRAGGEDISASTVFAQVDKEACILFVPNGSVDSYKNAPGWGEFTHIRPMLVEGDVTGDSIIDEADFVYVEKCIMGGIADPKADLNKDGKVNAADLVTLANLKLYGQTTPPSTK